MTALSKKMIILSKNVAALSKKVQRVNFEVGVPTSVVGIEPL